MNEIYLASRSPRRLELLQQMGVACKTVLLREETNRSRDVDESPLASENPFIYVERMAKMKAEIGSLRAKQRALPFLTALSSASQPIPPMRDACLNCSRAPRMKC